MKQVSNKVREAVLLYSTCLEYLIDFIKRLPHNKNIKVKKKCISATFMM